MNKRFFSSLLLAAFFVFSVSPVVCEDAQTETKAPQSAAQPNEAKAAESPPAQPSEPAKEQPAAPLEPGAAPGPSEKKTEPKEEAPAIEAGNVTVNFKGADIRTVLNYISEVAGVDIVPAPDVKGPVDLKLTNKPWKVALDVIVRNYGYAYEREGDIIRVDTVDKLKQQEPVTKTYDLNYAVAKDIVSAVKDMLSDRGKIVHDERTNLLLVTDIPTNMHKITQVVERLDATTPQVLIEARIIETVLGANEKMGIDWSVKITATGAKRPTTIPFYHRGMPFAIKATEKAFIPEMQTQGATSTTYQSGGQTVASAGLAQGTGPFDFPFVTQDLFQFGTLDFTQFSAVLEMLKERSNTEIVSNPRVATLNNQEAYIMVGETLGMPKYERNSTTGKMEITGYDPKDLGIKLKVTPHINTKEEIVIDLKPEISDLLRYDTLDAASGVKAPVFSTREATTKVMIRDGQTIFIGGLIKENNKMVKRKLPIIGDFLGDVPYLGLLFSKKETVKEKTELIFFITVNIINKTRTPEDLKGLPSVAKAYMPVYSLYEEKERYQKKRLKR